MNMKVCSLVLLFAFIFSTVFAPAYAAELKIGYVDVARVFDNYNRTKDQDKILEQQNNKKKEERDKIVKQIRKMKDELDILSEKAKERKQTQIDEKIRELQEYDQQTRNGLRQQRDEVVRKILKEIEQVTEKYANENSYTMILNNRVLLYGQKQHDITDKILKILNSEYKK
ncbi:MAG: OmpH family outer membrane protein [Candidatus Omnitrophota bacterium]|nr:MAG: OmpH family outer membrane protein [Candidatus Omnitrophota bacterium]